MVILGGSVIGGIGVAEVPQVGLASATLTIVKDSINKTITKKAVRAKIALPISTNCLLQLFAIIAFLSNFLVLD
jgi:hypothetical protein